MFENFEENSYENVYENFYENSCLPPLNLAHRQHNTMDLPPVMVRTTIRFFFLFFRHFLSPGKGAKYGQFWAD